MKATFIIFAFLFTAVFQVFSTTYYVRANEGSDANNGRSVGQAFATLTKMFSNSPALVEGDVIDISGTFDYNDSKQILVSITIQGTDKNTAIIQGTATKSNFFRIGNGTSAMPTITIENVTFQNMDYFDGTTSFAGGVIGVWAGSTLTCKNVNFLNNRSYSGGAINIADANATLEDCYFYNNKSARATSTNSDGGAINYTTGTATSLMINRCLFENNSSERIGSALRYRSNNTGIASTFTLQNSTFTGNTAKLPGSSTAGAIYIEGTNTTADVKLINNTIAYNSSQLTSATANAGLYIASLSNQVTLINNILFSNFNSAITPASVSISTATPALPAAPLLLKESRNNITDVASTTYDWTAKTTDGATMASSNVSAAVNTGQLDLATTLVDNGGATKTLSLAATSIAVNGGYVTGAALIDQRNIIRDVTPDIGAYEYKIPSGLTSVDTKGITIKQYSGKTIFANLGNFNRVKVFSGSGQLILDENLSGDDFRFNLNSGLYMVRFEGNGVTVSMKVLSKK